MCQPFAWTEAPGDTPQRMVATTDGVLYWTVSAADGSAAGSVRKATITPTPTVEVVSSNEPFAWALAVDDQYVYWSRHNAGDGTYAAVRRITRAPSSTPEDVATGTSARHARDVHVRGGTVYWLNSMANPNLYARLDEGTGVVRSVYTGTSLGGLLVGDTLVYAISNMSVVWTAPVNLPDGSMPVSAYAYGESSPGTVVESAMDDTRMAWSTDSGLIVVCLWPSLACSTMRDPEPGETNFRASGLALSGPWLYYTTSTTSAARSSSIYCVDSVSLANPVKLATADEARDIVVFGEFIYWSESSRVAPRIMAMRVPAPG